MTSPDGCLIRDFQLRCTCFVLLSVRRIGRSNRNKLQLVLVVCFAVMAHLDPANDWTDTSEWSDALVPSRDIAVAMQDQAVVLAMLDCLRNDSAEVWDPGAISCPRLWDGILCWESVPANTLVEVPCPGYIFGFDGSQNASKFCTDNGTWYTNPEVGTAWTNYTLCAPQDSDLYNEDISIFEPHLASIKLISKVGYSVSFIALVAAFFVLASIKRLRCPRNSLHMHLFMSFILRALAFLLKDALFIDGIGLPSNLDFNQQNVDCKAFTSLWHYMLMANYCWILMEGLYLHNLVFLAFSDSSGILKYVALGWGLPVLFIVPWVIARATLEDTLCWTTNAKQELFWIIRGPITASIVVNFILFVNITRVLFAKLFASQTPQARRYRYRKWFRSTLVLVPLFGAHYTLLLGMSLVAAADKLELAWLYIDQLFSSFQGFVVALLYCFLNGEVQTELRKLLHRWSCSASSQGQHHHRHSFFTQSMTYLSRGRSSNHSIQSDRRDGGSKSPSPNSTKRSASRRNIGNPMQEQISPSAVPAANASQPLTNHWRSNGCPGTTEQSVRVLRNPRDVEGGRRGVDSSEEHLLDDLTDKESQL
ncbi:secretin receptor-like isoform X2 [Ornithodoros turicata]|uniref:secretin receptor-like isoform X2 n=1 Tax=Ornithodoros turicata TaxID=34597 RepID=UPI0031388DFD